MERCVASPYRWEKRRVFRHVDRKHGSQRGCTDFRSIRESRPDCREWDMARRESIGRMVDQDGQRRGKSLTDASANELART